MSNTHYDTAIIGGGLAGLSLAILLADQGFKVILFEKEQYPFHKVCGEYISLESWDFLERLGLQLSDMELPIIRKLLVSAPDGTLLQQNLDLGGFGISRYYLDDRLQQIARSKGVTLLDGCKVDNVSFSDDRFSIRSSHGSFTATTCSGSFGKRSNIDVQWQRPFIKQAKNKLNNYIGIKYHIRTDFPVDTIALHNFRDGYCGISKIEEDRYCLCYLTNAQNLKDNNNSIDEMERNVLSKNSHLKTLFANSTRLYESPLSISQISFDPKSSIEDHVLLCGDAAGMITPLCGNGMSMAMHGAKLAAASISAFLRQECTRQQMEDDYEAAWTKQFASRLRTGRLIQRFFGKEWVTNLFVKVMKFNPWITKMIIRKTHGEPF